MFTGGNRARLLTGRLLAVAACATVLAGCGGEVIHPTSRPGAAGDVNVADGLRVTVLQTGLEVPWDLAFTPDGRMLVTERRGDVRVYASGEPGAGLLGTTPIPDVLRLGEGGGLGIAVDREFDRYPFAYVCATLDFDGVEGPMPAENQLLRFRVGDGGSLTLDGEPLLTGMRAHEHHDGCAVEMDAQNRIWLTMGDANTARSENLSQRPESLNGKVLRVERDGSVPADNPVLPGTSAPSAVFSMGHRNPQGIAFRDDGLVVAAEHGTDRDDELNIIVPSGNYGYACWSDSSTLGPAQEQEGPAGELCGPAEDYRAAAWASGMPTIAPSNLTFVQGSEWGDWDGDLLVAMLKETDLRRFELDEASGEIRQAGVLLDGDYGRLRATVIGPDGALYVTTANSADDMVLRITRE